MATCSECKNLDTEKKVNGEESGARYYCKKNKTVVSGDNEACESFEDAYRSNEDSEKIYQEGKSWDNDKNSGKFYFIIAIIILIIIVIAYLLNPGLF